MSGGYAGAIFQTQIGYQCTALICAAQNGNADCVRLLLEVGADKDAKTDVRHIAFSAQDAFCEFISVDLYGFGSISQTSCSVSAIYCLDRFSVF
jgi:hypothetical protein